MMLARNRATAVTLALFILVVCPSLARGLGLGDITLHSRLNEPLDASISLVQLDGVGADRIVVDLASRDNFERSGIAYPSFLDDISFSVDVHDRNTGVLKLSTERPIQEPYLDLIIDVRWPGGRMMREYTTLLDPPQYSAAGPEAADMPASSEDSETPAGQAADAGDSLSPQQQPAGAGPATGASDPDADDSLAGGETEDGGYRVGRDETLWQIALETRQDDSVSVQQMMLAIQRENQDAFINGNINTLRANAVLRIPDESDPVMPGQSEAVAEVRRQNRAAGLLDSAPLTPSPDGPAGTSDGDDELRVLSADELAEVGDEEGGGSARDEQIAALEMQLMMSEEELDRARLENRELVTRLDELNSQIELLDNIIDIEDARLAELQAALAARAEEEALAAAAEAEAATTPRAGSDEATETAAPAADTGMGAAEREAGTASAEPEADVGATLSTWLRNPLLLVDVVILLVALVVWLLIVRRRRAEAMEEETFESSYGGQSDDSHPHPGHEYAYGGGGRGDGVGSLATSESVQDDALTLEEVTDTERLWQDDNVTTEAPARRASEDDEFRALIAEADRLAGTADDHDDEDFVEFNLATAADEEAAATDSAASEAYPDVDIDNIVDEQADDDEVESFDFRLDDLLQDIDESPHEEGGEPVEDEIETFDYTPAEPGNDDAFDLGDLTFDENDLDAADDSDEVAEGEDETLSSRIDLAVAYEAMGDLEGARQILHQVLEEGEENDKAEARRLLDEWRRGGEAV